MITEVNNIIFNTLVAERAISLPGVGTLSIVRRAAEMESSDLITPPSYVVEFSSHGVATSVVNVIAHEANVDIMQAEDIYSRWLDKVRNDATLRIEGVGTLRDKSFVADAAFLNMFNSSSAKPIKVKRKKRGCCLFFIILLLVAMLLVGIGVAGLFFYNDIAAMFDKTTELPTKSNTAINTAEEVYDATIDYNEQAVTENVDECDCEANIEEVVEEIQQEEPIVANEPVATTWTANKDLRHWVIVGSYSTEENANKAISAIEAKYKDVDCEIFELGWMFAVASYGSNDRDDCEKFMRNYSNEFEQMWIHTPKRYK